MFKLNSINQPEDNDLKSPSKKNRPNRVERSPRESGFIARNYSRFLTAIIVAAALLYVVLNRRYGTGFLNDDAVYVITARDFWKTALTHPLLGIKPDFPFPGLPLLLYPFARLGAEQWKALEWVCVVAATALVYGFARIARRWLSAAESLVAVALLAFNPHVFRISSTVMPGIYFTLAVVLSFRMMSQRLGKPSFPKALLMGTVIGWGCVMRPEAFALLLGIVPPLFFTRNGRRLLLGIALPVSAWAGFLWLWFRSRATLHSEFGGDLRALKEFWPGHPGEIFSFGFMLIHTFVAGIAQTRQWETPYVVGLTVVVGVILIALLTAGVINLWKEKVKERPVLAGILIFLTSYTAIHIVWHVAEPRYLVPPLPFVVLFVVRGGSTFARSVSRGRFVAMAALLTVAFVYGFRINIGVTSALGTPEARFAAPVRTLEWLKNNSQPGDRVTSNIPSSVDLYSSRPCMGIITVDNGDEFSYLLSRQKIAYILLRNVEAVAPGVGETADPNIVVRQYLRWIHSYPSRLPVVFKDEEEGTTICRVTLPERFEEAYDKHIVASEDVDARRYFQALQTLDRSIAICPQLGSVQNLKGAVLFLSRNYAEAEQCFLTAADLAPDSSNTRLNLSNLYHQTGKEELVWTYMEKAAAASAINHNEVEFRQNSKTLQDLWLTGRSTIFIKMPHTELYSQIIE